MRKVKLGFTLSELLIALGVIAILAAVLLPIIFNLKPNQNIVMARRAYNVAQAAVSDMINDELCYPDLTNSSEPKVGFDDNSGYDRCTAWPESSTGDAHKKFRTIFQSKVDYAGTDGMGSGIFGTSKFGFRTKDGMWWIIALGSTDTSSSNYMLIGVDVNGDKAPNCWPKATAGHQNLPSYVHAGSSEICADDITDSDRFTISVSAKGRMKIMENWAINAVKVDNDFIGPADNSDSGE